MPRSVGSNPLPAPEVHRIDELPRNPGLTPPANVIPKAQRELSAAAPTPVVAPNGVAWLPVPGWQRTSWLWHGFSTRLGGRSLAYCPAGAQGELNLGFTADDDRENVLANRRLLAQAVTGDPATPLAALSQIHSNLVVLVGEANIQGTASPGSMADGLMTAAPGQLLAVQTADCIPVLVADRRLRAVAAFHAGWRGTVKRIVEAGIGRMTLEFGSRPEDLIAAIGPGVGPCCYRVGQEVLSEFESQFAYSSRLFRQLPNPDPVRGSILPALHLDLIEANRRQLLDAGLKPRAIKVVGGCTSCHPALFFSHRASGGRAGRMMAVIGIRPPRPGK